MSAEETFQVDGIELGFGESTITFTDGVMNVHLVAQSAPHAQRPDLFDQQYSYLQPAIRLDGVTFPTPECRVALAFEANPSGNRHGLWLDGFADRRDLQGEVRIENNVLLMSGELRSDYGGKPGPQILICKRFETGDVDPRLFAHTDLDYALSLDPAFIGSLSIGAWRNPHLSALGTLRSLRHLSLDGYDLGALFDEFDRFTELESLRLSGKELASLPPSVCRLSSLKRLSIADASLVSLPAEIGQLEKLESLSINRTQLRSVPPSLLRLPRLHYIDLQWNQLESLPEIPEAVAFSHIGLKGNRFVQLPAFLSQVKKVEIEPRLKPLYMDATFKTPHTQTVDPLALRAAGDPAFIQKFDNAIARHDLTDYREPLLQTARQSVLFQTTVADDYAQVGNTRFGGEPDLPPGFVWPVSNGCHWLFLAQINLADIAPLQTYLPRSGLLSFLVNDLEYVREVSVQYHAPGTILQRTCAPEDAVFDQGPFTAFHAAAQRAYSFPFLYRAEQRFSGESLRLAEIECDDALHDRYGAFCAEFIREPGHGENGRHGINVHVFTQNESPEEQAAERSGGQADEWVVLLSLTFDKNTGFSFWDAGTLTFMIHGRDLAARDFSRVVASIESS